MPTRTYYINATTGSDAASGGIDAPWATLAFATSNADWAGNDGIVFILTGTFTISTQIVATPITKPLLITAASLGAATIVYSIAANSGIWSVQTRLTFFNIVVRMSTANYPILPPYAKTCRFERTGSSGSYLAYNVNSVWHEDCEYRGTPAIGAGMTLGSGNSFVRCLFVDMHWINAAAGAGFANQFSLCRFLRLRSSAIGTPPLEFANVSGGHNALYHCSFFDCGWQPAAGTPIVSQSVAAASWPNHIVGCVVASSRNNVAAFASGLRLARYAGNYVHGSTGGLGTPIALGSEAANGVLTTPPFADAAGGDWSPSAELKSIVLPSGLIPGAIQPAGEPTGQSGFSMSHLIN